MLIRIKKRFFRALFNPFNNANVENFAFLGFQQAKTKGFQHFQPINPQIRFIKGFVNFFAVEIAVLILSSIFVHTLVTKW